MQGSARCITFLLVSGSLVWFVGSQPSHALQTGQDPADPVEAYLLKLGLTDHALEYLENELVKRPNREPLARELATLYTTKILQLHSQAQVEEIQKKVRILLGKYPSIRTPQLETILLQADFTRAEGEFAKWVFDPEDAKSRTTAGDTFGRIGGEFKSHAIVLEAAKQKIENEIEKLNKFTITDEQLKTFYDKHYEVIEKQWKEHVERILGQSGTSVFIFLIVFIFFNLNNLNAFLDT